MGKDQAAQGQFAEPLLWLGRGVGVVDMRGKTGLWMLNFEPGGPAGLKEKRVGCKK